MQLELIGPARRTLAARNDLGKDTVAGHAQLVAQGKRAGIEERNAGRTAFRLIEQGAPKYSTTRREFNTTAIACQSGEPGQGKPWRMGTIKAFELALAQE